MINKKNFNKIIILVVVVAVIAAFKVFHLGDYFTLAYIKESQRKFEILYGEHRLTVIAVYMSIYILVPITSRTELHD